MSSASRPPRLPFGLRARLTVVLAALVLLALAVSFLATYNGTGTQVRKQIDNDLTQAADVLDVQAVLPGTPKRPADVYNAAFDYVVAQNLFTPGGAARLYYVRVVGHLPKNGFTKIDGVGLVTNDLGLFQPTGATKKERKRHEPDVRKLMHPRAGFSTLHLSAEQNLRLLVRPIRRGGKTVALSAVAESLGAVNRAKSSVRRTYLVTGLIVFGIALGAGWLVASGISRPLRKMARTVARIDAGGLQHRVGSSGPRDEVRTLAEAFDRMLDRLEDAFARQRSFVSDASHELRTPLTVIRGQLEVLSRQTTVTTEDVLRVEGMVRTEILRMERLAEDLLLLARADEAELLRPEPLDLDSFVTELFDGLTLTADRRFELGTLPGGEISADADRIAQAVRNLVRNAVEHTREPDGLVRLVVLPKGADGIQFAVEDDGPGIPLDQRDRVFDRFHRIDVARDRAAGGAGLGLAIARAIVEAHGGRIYAGESTAGGARVAFELPGYTRPRGPTVRDKTAAQRA